MATPFDYLADIVARQAKEIASLKAENDGLRQEIEEIYVREDSDEVTAQEDDD